MARRLGLLAFLLLAAPALADDRGAPEGFTPLFDGKSLDGWRMVNTRDNFKVRDGLLVMDRGSGWLATEKTFGDFELRLHYRFITPGTDSGVFIRASLEGKNWTGRGYQIQNMDNRTLGQVLGMGVKVKGEHKPDVVARVKKPSGEWQDLTILAKGQAARVTLNGEVVGTSDDLSLTDGHIGLQAEGGVIEFERIDLKPLGPDADRSAGRAERSRRLDAKLHRAIEEHLATATEIEALKGEVEALKERLETLKNRLRAAQEKDAGLTADIEDLEKQVIKLKDDDKRQ